MSDLLQHVNIGKDLEERLVSAGIDSFKKLKKAGSKRVFKLLKKYDECACINKLYALEGAVQDIRWHNLDEEKKKELKEYFKSLK